MANNEERNQGKTNDHSKQIFPQGNRDGMHAFEDRVKNNLVIWFLGLLLTGYLAGVATVKWIDDRYKVETISIAEKREFEKSKQDLVKLQESHKTLEEKYKHLESNLNFRDTSIRSLNEKIVILTTSNEQLIANAASTSKAEQSCTSQEAALASARAQAANLKTELVDKQQLALDSSGKIDEINKMLRECKAQAKGGVELPELENLTLTINYMPKRVADANRIAQKLAVYFRKVHMNSCKYSCDERGANILYSSDATPTVAYTVAQLLTKTGISGFSEPSLSQTASSYGPMRIDIYLK